MKITDLSIWSLFRWIKNIIWRESINSEPTEFALISSGGSFDLLYGGTCEPTRLIACHYLKITPVPRAIALNLIPREGWYHIRFF